MEGTTSSVLPGFFRGTITSEIDDIKDVTILKEETQITKNEPCSNSSTFQQSLESRIKIKLQEIEISKCKKIEQLKELELWEQKLKFALSDQKPAIPIHQPLILDHNNYTPSITISSGQLFDLIWNGTIIPKLQTKITRDQKTLPIKIKIRLAAEIHQMIFGNEVFEIADDLQLEMFAKEFYRKSFTRGSYAQLFPPLRVYKNRKNTLVEINYKVFNKNGVLQWPI